MKVYKEIENEILTAHKIAGINFVWLVDNENEIIIPRNQRKEGYQDKIKEIKKRLPFLSPGTYFLNGLTSQNTKKVKPLQFTLTIGQTGISETAPVRVTQTETVNVLSYSEALKRAEEISVLKIENENLKKQIKELEEANDELAEELEEIKGKQKETETPTLLSQGKDFLNQILPIVSPLADEYFRLQNRKLDILSQNKPAPVTPRARVNSRTSPDLVFRPHPEQNPELWEQYLQELDNLNDEQFNNELEFLQNNYPLQYSYVEQIFLTEGTNDINETEAEE